MEDICLIFNDVTICTSYLSKNKCCIHRGFQIPTTNFGIQQPMLHSSKNTSTLLYWIEQSVSADKLAITLLHYSSCNITCPKKIINDCRTPLCDTKIYVQNRFLRRKCQILSILSSHGTIPCLRLWLIIQNIYLSETNGGLEKPVPTSSADCRAPTHHVSTKILIYLFSRKCTTILFFCIKPMSYRLTVSSSDSYHYHLNICSPFH